MNSNESSRVDHTKASKFISFLLRHNPDAGNLRLDAEGWTNTKDLLKALHSKKYFIKIEDLIEIVNSDEKGRYSLTKNNTRIRANQGHSIINLSFEEKIPPCFLYHGTSSHSLKDVFETGLSKMKRHHVHLSLNKQTALSVGKRHGKPILLEINCEQMVKDGFVFYLSENQVWLVDHVPTKYFEICSED